MENKSIGVNDTAVEVVMFFPMDFELSDGELIFIGGGLVADKGGTLRDDKRKPRRRTVVLFQGFVRWV